MRSKKMGELGIKRSQQPQRQEHEFTTHTQTNQTNDQLRNKLQAKRQIMGHFKGRTEVATSREALHWITPPQKFNELE